MALFLTGSACVAEDSSIRAVFDKEIHIPVVVMYKFPVAEETPVLVYVNDKRVPMESCDSVDRTPVAKPGKEDGINVADKTLLSESDLRRIEESGNCGHGYMWVHSGDNLRLTADTNRNGKPDKGEPSAKIKLDYSVSEE